jgi:hypothetical protein
VKQRTETLTKRMIMANLLLALVSRLPALVAVQNTKEPLTNHDVVQMDRLTGGSLFYIV